jgi:hypothetical protein
MKNRTAFLLLALLIVASGFRGDTARKSDGNYVNDIKVTATGVYLFSPNQPGTTGATAANHARPDFVDIYNGTGTEATIVLFRQDIVGTLDSTVVYVPALTARGFPGSPIDSIRVASATFGGASIILGGMD